VAEATWLDPLRLDAGSPEPDLPRRGARDAARSVRAEKIGVTPYSPLASGRLTRDWSSEKTLRSETDQIAKSKYDATAETDQRVVERVAEIAKKLGVPARPYRAGLAVTEGAGDGTDHRGTKISHLEDAIGALSVKLTQEEGHNPGRAICAASASLVISNSIPKEAHQ